MKAYDERMRTIRPLAIAAALAACLQLVSAETYVIHNGQKIVGSAIMLESDGSVGLIRTAPGGGKTKSKFPAGTRAYPEMPEDVRTAVKLIRNQRFDKAIPVLRKVVTAYEKLYWDAKACALIATCYVEGKKDYASAQLACDQALARSFVDPKTEAPEIYQDRAFMSVYSDVLVDRKEHKKLTDMIPRILAMGSREAAAVAQNLRADAAVASGDLEGGIIDYLRTYVFFRRIKDEDTVAEAVFKTAQTFERLRDQKRAKEFYNKVLDEFPRSKYVGKAQRALSSLE